MQSMTGYGRSLQELDGRMMSVEVRTVNHRFLDLSCRVPRVVGFLEEDIRREVSARLSRGHVDVLLTYENHRTDARQVFADIALAKAYQDASGKVALALGSEERLSLSQILAMEDVLTVREGEEDQEAVRKLLILTLNKALDQVIEMRTREGEKLSGDLLEKTRALEGYRQAVEKRAPSVVSEYRDKLKLRLSALVAGELDEGRFLTEVALFADRAAIDEELVRLRSHLGQVEAALALSEPVGRKLDFLVQELNREVNTIGSKAMDADITRDVVAMKGIIEKLREQVQNLE